MKNKAPCCIAAAHALSLSLVHKCSTATSLREARRFHALILTSTVFTTQSPFVNNNIISMYARCGSLKDSHLVFDKMPHRTLVSYNSLIASYSRVSEHAISAFRLYTQMETRGVRPSSITFTSLLQASSMLEDLWVGSLLHAQGLKFGFLNDICVQTSLLNMYSNCRDLGSAEMVFGDMAYTDRDAHVIVRNVAPDLHLQNALLDMYCNVGNTQTAYRIFVGMENPDLVSWNSMIAGFLSNIQ